MFSENSAGCIFIIIHTKKSNKREALRFQFRKALNIPFKLFFYTNLSLAKILACISMHVCQKSARSSPLSNVRLIHIEVKMNVLPSSFISAVRFYTLFKISPLQHCQQKTIILAAQTEIPKRAFVSKDRRPKL